MIKKITYYYNRLLPVFKSIAIRKGIIPGHHNYQKILLLGNARVGSTLLQSYLNEHPKIYCEGEIYNTDHLKFYGKPEKLKSQMFSDPMKFLSKYGYPKHSKKIKLSGFKLFYSHFKTKETKIIWDYLKENKDIKIIHIKRRNTLRSLVSLKIASKTNKWRSFNEMSDIQEKQISLTKEECIKEFELHEKIYSEIDKIFNKHKIIEVYYTDLINEKDKTMNKVFDFLNVEKIILQDTVLKKQNPEPISELILNYSGLKNEFKNSEWETFFDDSRSLQ